jgi:hypothetical protein
VRTLRLAFHAEQAKHCLRGRLNERQGARDDTDGEQAKRDYVGVLNEPEQVPVEH